MKAIWIMTLIIMTLLVSSCNTSVSISPAPTTGETNVLVTPTSNTASTYPLLKTTLGDFAVLSVRLVDKAHENTAPEGYKFLLVGLARPDLQKLVAGEFSYGSFQSAFGSGNEVYVLGGDGTQTAYKGMGGWLDNDEPVTDDFVIGFLVTLAESYTLYWTNNSPIPLSIEE